MFKQENQKDIYEHMYLFYVVSRPRIKTLTVANVEHIGIENITYHINSHMMLILYSEANS